LSKKQNKRQLFSFFRALNFFCHPKPLAFLLGAACLGMTGWAFCTGIALGMDQRVGSEALLRVATGYACSFTKKFLGIGGFAVSEQIFHDLEHAGLTLQRDILEKLNLVPRDFPQDGIFTQHIQNGAFLDQVIRAGLARGSEYRDLSHTIRGFGDDVGLATFISAASSLFGYHIRALYYLYSLLHLLSVAGFVLERRKDPLALASLLAFLCLLYSFCFYSPHLLPDQPPQLRGSGNMVNPRFLSVLAMVPAFHLVWMTARRVPISAGILAVALLQSLLVCFAIQIRVTAAWIPLGFLLVLLGVTVCRLFLKSGSGFPLPSLASCWPLGVCLLAATVSHVWTRLSFHPQAYGQKGSMSSHTLWHAVYYSLQGHPQYQAKYAAAHDFKVDDDMPLQAVTNYLRNHPEKETPEIYITGKTLKGAAYERLCREAFWEFFRKDPRFVVETFFVVHPAGFAGMFFEVLRTEVAEIKFYFWALLGAVELALVMALRKEPGPFLEYLLILFLASLPCLAVPILTVCGSSVTPDQQLLLRVFAFFSLAWLLAWIFRQRQPGKS
jgi:hypothetical protein